jgi:RNA polymerase sigma-70 factor (ECF subfamily)
MIDLNEALAAHRSPLLAYVRGIVRDKHAAEDLTQETLLRASRGFWGLKDLDRLVPWLYRIATNVCRDYLRKEKRAGENFDRAAGSISPDELRDENAPQLDKVIECAEMGECVRRYFDKLSDPYRAVIILHDLEGMTNPCIANFMGISLHTAKIRLHRARAQLREMLQDACNFYTDERGILVCEPKCNGRNHNRSGSQSREETGTK